MKQLLIVNSTAALNAKNPSGSVTATDFSGLKPGAIAFAECATVDEASPALLSAPATKNFCIALGRPNGQIPFLIPEVDIKSLRITKATYSAATTFEATFTVPDPADVATLVNPTSMVHSPIAEYGIALIKKNTVPHERNRWSVMVASQSDTASVVAKALVDAINDKTSETFPFSAENSGAEVTVTCLNAGEAWTIKFTDCLDSLNRLPINALSGDTVEITEGVKAMGDKADIQDLASRCAAGKGFTDVYRDGATIYPGYPETVEDTNYNVYTLRFRVGRDGAKTRDERVWQVVHIAVPDGATAEDDIAAILPEGEFLDTMMGAAGAKAVADAAEAEGD